MVTMSRTRSVKCLRSQQDLPYTQGMLQVVDQKKMGVKTKGGLYPWTDEGIERVIHQRDEALSKIIEVIRGLNRGDGK